MGLGPFASQADMEAGTSLTLAVSPGVVQFHLRVQILGEDAAGRGEQRELQRHLRVGYGGGHHGGDDRDGFLLGELVLPSDVREYQRHDERHELEICPCGSGGSSGGLRQH